MGLFDWIRERLTGKKPDLDLDDDEVAESAPTPQVAAPAAEAKAPEKPKKKAKAPKAQKPPKAESAPVERKAKGASRKKRKGTNQMGSRGLPEGVVHQQTEVLSVEEAERRYGDLVAPAPEPEAEAEPEAVPEPAPVPVVAAPAPVFRPRPEPPKAKEDPDAYRRWVVTPQFEALLADAQSAVDGADPARLRSARKAFTTAWRRLGDVPVDRPDLQKAHDTLLQHFEARLAAAPDPRRQAQEANAIQKQALIAEVEALHTAVDLGAAIQRVKALQLQWREVGPVPKEQVEPLKTRWKEVCDAVFARRSEEREAKRARLERLVSQAESLSQAADPQQAAERMKGLQAEWKAVGSAGRGEDIDQLWARFRAAADATFARRGEARTKLEAENLVKKQGIVVRLQALAEVGVEDPDPIIDQARKDWRRIGHVPREQSDAIWSQFTAACDALRAPPPIEGDLGSGEALSFNPFAAALGQPEDGGGSGPK